MDFNSKYQVLLSEEVDAFLSALPPKARAKILYNIKLVEGGLIDKDVFKKLEGTDIWEFRTLFNKVCYRVLAFWDTGRSALIIATHGFIKKTQKTPIKEIERAIAIKTEYFNTKRD